MNIKALALGAAIGFLAAVVPACNGAKCSPANCEGCCSSDGTCVAPADTSETACGASGLECKACDDGETCVDGQCKDGTVAGECDATSCPNGCCVGKTCLQGNNANNCGTGGAACVQCGTDQTCNATTRVCEAAAVTVKVGSACANNGDCATLGANAICKLTTTSGNATYQGGYCSVPCTNPQSCPAGSTCVGLDPIYGEGDTFCWDTCSQSDTCRTGYACYGLSQTTAACWIDPLPEPDAGPAAGDGIMGGPCTQNSDCQPPSTGGCLPATLPDAGPSQFTGGYCTGDCGFNPGICGNGAVCLSVSQTDALCFGSCNGPLAGQANCRSGYVCKGITQADGGLAADGFCNPDCNVVAATGVAPCPTNYACAPTMEADGGGYCCPNDGGACR